MAAIKLAAFSGEQPQIIPRLLPGNASREAINARIEDGSLSPYRKPTLTETLATGPFSTIYKHGADWLAFTNVVNAAPGPVADDRLYYTGDGVPKLKVGATVYPLGVPYPSSAPTAALSGSGSGDIQTRSYVYTFVTAYGEESEPCAASNEVAWKPGYDVYLTGIKGDPGGRNITLQRFYRTQSGSLGTDYYFIAERAVSNADFTDDIDVDEFAEPLPSRYWNAPPDGLTGLIPFPNGMMAAFVGKELYFCEPFRPHAWPEIYTLTMDVPIVGLAAAGTTLWVLTEGYPYRVTGTTPTAMVSAKVEANLPCVNARGIVDLGHAVAWPSVDGLAAADASGPARIVSDNLFSPRDWRRLNPGTMRAGQINGRWIGSYNGTDETGDAISGSILIDISDKSFLIRSDVQSEAWFYDIGTGFLFFLDEDLVRQFDSPTGDIDTLYWRSKLFVLPKPETMGCILVESGADVSQEEIDARDAIADQLAADNAALIAAGSIGGDLAGEAIGAVPVAGDILAPIPSSAGSSVSVGVYADGKLVASVSRIDEVLRLPSGFMARKWEIDVFGDITIDQITIAHSMSELKIASGGP